MQTLEIHLKKKTWANEPNIVYKWSHEESSWKFLGISLIIINILILETLWKIGIHILPHKYVYAKIVKFSNSLQHVIICILRNECRNIFYLWIDGTNNNQQRFGLNRTKLRNWGLMIKLVWFGSGQVFLNCPVWFPQLETTV